MKSTKFVSWLRPFLVLSIICGFALTATAQNYFPSMVGNTWVLLSTDGAEQRTYTFEAPETVDGEELILYKIAKESVGTGVVVFDTSWVTVAEDGEIILHQVAFDRGAFGIAEATFDPPVTNYPAALPLGQTWEVVTETVLKLVGAATTTSILEVVAIEDVETPSGVFKDCVKVVINREAVTALQRLRENEILWLAPDVGPVKFQDTNEIVFNLVSYNLVEPPAVEEMPVVEEMPPAEEPVAEETPAVEEAPTTEETPATIEEPSAEEPVVEAPIVPKTFSFDLTLEPGLNMISIPLMPEEPYTAKSLAEMLAATMVIQFDAGTQHFVGYTILEEGDGFGIEGGMGYIVNTPAVGMVNFTGKAWDNQSDADADNAPAAPALSTYKSVWAFVVTSDVRGMQADTGYTLVAENLRTGIIATENITSDVKRSAAVWADMNRKSVVEAGDKLEISLYDERGTVVSGPFQRTVSTDDIRNAFLSLQLTVGDVQPKDTILAQNYPNPFNPETWIPYQLSKPTEVTISIHNVAGQLVRTLDLGLQPVGSYMTPSTAAYWDGKNSVGEHVSSGIYFYTLQTADFAATRRMVILK